jgi:hypothetical protein
VRFVENVREDPRAEAGTQTKRGTVVLRRQIEPGIARARDIRCRAKACVDDVVQLAGAGERLRQRDQARQLARPILDARLEHPVRTLKLPDQTAVLTPEAGRLEPRPHHADELGRGNGLRQVSIDLPHGRYSVLEVRVAGDQEDGEIRITRLQERAQLDARAVGEPLVDERHARREVRLALLGFGR